MFYIIQQNLIAMKRLFILLSITVLLFSCENLRDSNKDIEKIDQLSELSDSELLTPAQINAEINKSLERTGDFNWNDASDLMIWSALVHGGNILTVGYIQEVAIKTKSTGGASTKQNIIAAVAESESEGTDLKTARDVLIFDDEDLVLVDLDVKNISTVLLLRGLDNIRYLEPAVYSLFNYSESNSTLKSSGIFGCDNTSVNLVTGDYVSEAPGCKVPWNYYSHNIPSAWTLSTGSGVTVGLIDTGVSPYQSLLGSGFNDGYSSGRTILKYGVYVDSFWPWVTKTDGSSDKCGHGTSMAAAIAAPRNNNNLPVGVAYNTNLIAYRATSDVILDGYHEQKGVAKALVNLGNTSSVKIISMSIGHVFTVNRIKDAVIYAYNRDKLIIAAGGTSTWFTNNLVEVIFPANMSQTVAVTGITNDGSYTQCNDCHKGSKIDFTVVMQRYNDSERVTPVVGFYENSTRYSGGSSVSTAMTAGMAALVWSIHPGWSRSQVLLKLMQSAELYPNKSSNYGYGCIDAYEAVN